MLVTKPKILQTSFPCTWKASLNTDKANFSIYNHVILSVPFVHVFVNGVVKSVTNSSKNNLLFLALIYTVSKSVLLVQITLIINTSAQNS